MSEEKIPYLDFDVVIKEFIEGDPEVESCKSVKEAIEAIKDELNIEYVKIEKNKDVEKYIKEKGPEDITVVVETPTKAYQFRGCPSKDKLIEVIRNLTAKKPDKNGGDE